MKLLAAGLALIATGLALVLFTYADPAGLFIVGVVCCLLGVVNLLTPSYSRGAPVSASDTSDAENIIRDVRNHHY